ncbi:MAG: hypothetical protein RBS57_06065 [Desulforhabdus sp.]|jgi:hypothetical protein|nr:hypothetical protein [Desulforhabdus sp.]
MKKIWIITILLAFCVVLGTGLSYARQGGRGYGPGDGNCPYRNSVRTGAQQSKAGWYCPRSGAWTNVRNQYGPMRSAGGQGYGRMNPNQDAVDQ